MKITMQVNQAKDGTRYGAVHVEWDDKEASAVDAAEAAEEALAELNQVVAIDKSPPRRGGGGETPRYRFEVED